MTSINFGHNKKLDPNTAAGFAVVTLMGPSANIQFAQVLVDSGADYVQLPMWAAQQVGLNFSNAKTLRVNGATGSALMNLLAQITIEIEGKQVSVEVLFDPSQGRPLLGRNALRVLGNEYGFDLTDWHWNT
jgi:predicted aspartyl protease